jgi:hypothetical protein
MIPTPAEVKEMNKNHRIKEDLRRQEQEKIRIDREVQQVSAALFRTPMNSPISMSHLEKVVAETVASKARDAGWEVEVSQEMFDGVANNYTHKVRVVGPA